MDCQILTQVRFRRAAETNSATWHNIRRVSHFLACCDVTRNSKQIHFRGKNLIVWKKQNDVSWNIFRYMYDEIPAKK